MKSEWTIIGVLCVFILVVYVASMYYGPQLAPKSLKESKSKIDRSSKCLTQSCRDFASNFAKPLYDSASKSLLKYKE